MQEMKVKIEVKVYKCEYCGKQHLSIPERTKCEMNCEAEQKRKADQEKAKKLQEEKSGKFQKLQELVDEINDKYDENIIIVKGYNYHVNYNGLSISKFLESMRDYSRTRS